MKRKCREIEKLISAGIDGMLEDHEQEILQEHVRACFACQAVYNDFKALHDRLHVKNQSAEVPILSESFDNRFFDRLQKEMEKPSALLLQSPRLRLVPVCTLLLLAIGIISFNRLYRTSIKSGDLTTPRSSLLTGAITILENEEDMQRADTQAKEILHNFL